MQHPPPVKPCCGWMFVVSDLRVVLKCLEQAEAVTICHNVAPVDSVGHS